MNLEINDREAFQKVSVAGLNAYLESQGWIREETWQDRIVIWSRERAERRNELLTPLREHSSTYSIRIGEVVSELAEVEERPQFDIYQDLIAARADVVRFRSLNGTGSREWSLHDSAALLTTSRDLLAAAARFADNPGQPVYRWRASGEVANYLSNVRPVFGLRFWHDFALHSPVAAGYGSQGDLGDDFAPPFGRQAMLALHRGLSEARGAQDQVLSGADIEETFEAAVEHGLNANLCDALAGLVERVHGVSVGLTWASVRPKDVSWEGFNFGESSIDVFREGAEWLRHVSPFLNANVVGEVVILEREENRPFDGQTVVIYELDNKAISLYVQFGKGDHDKVKRAFENGIPVSLYGDIHLQGRKYELRSPRNVSLLPSD